LSSSLRRAIGLLGACVVAAMAAHMGLSMLLGGLMVALFKPGSYINPPYLGVPFLYIYLLDDVELAKRAFFVSELFYAAFLLLLARGGSFLSSLREAAAGRPSSLLQNGLALLLLSYGVTLFLSLLASSASEAAGVPVGTLPKDDPIMQFIGVSLAPINEEVTFRLLLLGLPAALLLRAKAPGSANFLRMLWRPSSGAQGRVPASLHALVALSSAIFGLAHLAGGWEPGKFFPAAIAGAALGELYVYVGLHAAIMLHWSFNYYNTVSYYWGQTAPSLITSLYDQASSAFELVASLASLLLLSFVAFERLFTIRLKLPRPAGL